MFSYLLTEEFKTTRLISFFSLPDHVSPLLESLHWLPISKIIDYKLSSLCHSAVTGTGSQYLSDLLLVYIPSRQLRSSSDDKILRLPTFKTKHSCQRSFLSRPLHLEHASSLCQTCFHFNHFQISSENLSLQAIASI